MSILFQNRSPHSSLVAIVENHGDVIYFYLWDDTSDFGVRSCWVRNLKPAPAEFKHNAEDSTDPPLLTRNFCRHQDGAPHMVPESLHVVWLEEGNGAALFEDDEILAVIPPWSGKEGFHGYARDCTGKSPVCWDLDEDNVFHVRLREAREYWQSWERPSNPWQLLQPEFLHAIEKSAGKESKYFAIDGGKWPPKALVQVPMPEAIALITLGVCMRSQPNVEMYFDNPSSVRRIELAMLVGRDVPEAHLGALRSFISAQTRYPWEKMTFFDSGHTITCDALEGFSTMLLMSQPRGAPKIELPNFRGDPINMLWLIPLTESERVFQFQHSSQALIDKLNSAREAPIHTPERQSVV